MILLNLSSGVIYLLCEGCLNINAPDLDRRENVRYNYPVEINEIRRAFTEKRLMISVVTVYEPNPDEWIDNRIRR